MRSCRKYLNILELQSRNNSLIEKMMLVLWNMEVWGLTTKLPHLHPQVERVVSRLTNGRSWIKTRRACGAFLSLARSFSANILEPIPFTYSLGLYKRKCSCTIQYCKFLRHIFFILIHLIHWNSSEIELT